MRHRIAYASPAGTTRRAAIMIQEALSAAGQTAELFDLREYMRGSVPGEPDPACVWIGSPVYRHHPLPHCLEYIQRVAVPEGSWCVPFVTWGGVTTGVALEELAEAARSNGLRIAGGARVLCVHSSRWREPNPPHAHRPGQKEQALLAELAGRVVSRIQAGEEYPLDSLRQRNEAILQAAATSSFQGLRDAVPTPDVDAEACLGCGLCADECPVDAISMAGEPPLPRIAAACIRCRWCVRICPEGALLADMTGVPEHLATMIERFREPAETTIF